MKNENTQNKARRFRIVVTDLREDETLMDLTTNAAIVTAASPFDNLNNKDNDGHTQGAQYFNCKVPEIMHCIQSTIEGLGKLVAEHEELEFPLKLWMMLKKAESLCDEAEEEEDEEDE